MSSSITSSEKGSPEGRSTQVIKHNKSTIDYHRKVDGRDRRITLSPTSAKCIFELNKRLGHRTIGGTIEWLLRQVKPTVDAILLGKSTPVISSNSSPIFPSLPPRFMSLSSSSSPLPESSAMVLPLITPIFQNNVLNLAPFGSVFTVAQGSVLSKAADANKAPELEKNLVPCNCVSFAAAPQIILSGEILSSIDASPSK